MINFDNVTKKKIKKIIQTGHKFLIIHTVLIIGGSGSKKKNALLYLINHKLYTDKIY